MTNKEEYAAFCGETYVPIYSKPWWMDVVCGPESWDVWLYRSGGNILAAMPYYMTRRGEYRYITKAPLTQCNGLIFREEAGRKAVARAELEEKIINAACHFIDSLGVDVYEQQFHYSFQNWQPFFWNNCTNVLRYTYVIQDTGNLTSVVNGFTSNCRKNIRKGQRLTQVSTDISASDFYTQHEKVFARQGLRCPFSRELWTRLYQACHKNQAGQMFCAKDSDGNIHSLLFLVWDERSVYHLLGGYMPEFSSSQSYSALTYHGICAAHEKGLAYDFEGSMIRQIAAAFRQFGGVPMPYYRIRKVFNPEIVRREAREYIERIQREKNERTEV